MSIASDLERHSERLVIWHFYRGITVVCTEAFTDVTGKNFGVVGTAYVAFDYLPEMDYLSVPALGGYVNAKRFKLR